jgi:hypothetical protein
MMRVRTLITMATGFAAGYVAGAAAGRPAYERIRTRTDALVSELGLKDAAGRLQVKGEGVAKATADLASTATSEAVDRAATKVEQQLTDAQARLQSSAVGSSHA